MNRSKKHDPRQWQTWHRSGASRTPDGYSFGGGRGGLGSRGGRRGCPGEVGRPGGKGANGMIVLEFLR